jgi:hypothetical protein
VSAPAHPSRKRGGAAATARPPRDGGRAPAARAGGGRGRRPAAPDGDPPRPLYTAGGFAAAWAAGIGLAVLMTITLVGWVAAPHGTFGEDIADLFRAAVQGWLVGHNVGFGIPGGRVTMLPLGLVVLPGLLLYRAGRWIARSCDLPRLRHVFRAALAVAGPYAAISGTLALIAQTEYVRPSMFQALVAGFVLAFAFGGLGALVQMLRDKGIPKRRLLDLMPARSRSLLVGTASATGVLLATGALLFGTGLGARLDEAVAITQELAPGSVGGVLLVVTQLVYVPNALVFGLSYAVGPGFALGADTMVAPTGVSVGALPLFPMLAAVPENGPAPVLSLLALAAPLAAGAVGGVLTQRSAPDVVSEAAPLWGFVCGVSTGLVCAALCVLAGGPVGAHRLAEVGPSAWQVGLITALEVGVAAAIAAWVANWRYYRTEVGTDAATDTRPASGAAARPAPDRPAATGRPRPVPAPRRSAPAAERPAPANGPEPEAPAGRRRPRLLSGLRPRRARRDDADDDDDAEELYGITYEADPAPADPDPRDG